MIVVTALSTCLSKRKNRLKRKQRSLQFATLKLKYQEQQGKGHVDGQDGPDDFDRPQTVASYYAAASVVFGVGVDFAVVAAKQIFDLIDIRYDGEMSPERKAAVKSEEDWLMGIREAVLREAERSPSGFSRALIDQHR